MTSFTDLGVPAALTAALTAQGITAPFPIQTATLPDSLAGRDVLGRGRTGSGKTLAFALPLVVRLAATAGKGKAPRRPRALVLAPTRELASQIDATIAPLAKVLGLNTTVIFGGVSQGKQTSALNGGIDIVIACPGRLEDLLNQKALTLDDVQITVLDEADHMADLGFLPGVKRIMDKTPKAGQRLLFSATLDKGVDQLVKRYLTSPVEHSVDSAESPVAAMTHHLFEVRDADAKKQVVHHLASGTGRRVLFMRTKHQAKKLAKQLTMDGIPAVDLHGNLAQGARERNLEAFSSGAVRVLVATDIAARGIHVDDIELVVHVDPPAEHKAYLHRSGRTARAGSGGDVVTIVLPEQRGDVRALTRAAKITATPKPVFPGDATLTRLVGEVADAREVRRAARRSPPAAAVAPAAVADVAVVAVAVAPPQLLPLPPVPASVAVAAAAVAAAAAPAPRRPAARAWCTRAADSSTHTDSCSQRPVRIVGPASGASAAAGPHDDPERLRHPGVTMPQHDGHLMAIISRGFRGKREVDPRIPPGQYLERGFPVLSAGPTPRADLSTWTFSITAGGAPRASWTWSELTHLPHDDIVKDIHCVTKWSKLDSVWRGISLDTLLDGVEVAPQEQYVMAHCDGGYTTNVPLADLRGGKAWIAYQYDGAPLPPEHGGPARLLIPHLYFWKSAKWVRSLDLMTEDTWGFWERLGYHAYGDPWKEQRYWGD